MALTGFSYNEDNDFIVRSLIGFSTNIENNLFVTVRDDQGNLLPNIPIVIESQSGTLIGPQATVESLTDENGTFQMFVENTGLIDVTVPEFSEIVGNQFVIYQEVQQTVDIVDNSINYIIELVLTITIISPNLTIKLVNKSFDSIFNADLNVKYNINFEDNLNTGSSGQVGPIRVVPDISDQVEINFAGNGIYKASTLLYTKTDVELKETINFVLEEQPETIAYLNELTKILLNINIYKIFKARYFGGDCSKIEQISCEIFNLKKEVERLDIDNNQDDLNYFENIKPYIDELLTQIETQKILTTRYFAYDLSSIYIQSRTISQIVLDWLGTLKNNTNVFIVERSEDNITFTEVSRGLLSNFTDSELPHNTLYYYRISIDNADSYTDPLNISARTLHLPIDTFTATTISESQIDLAWTDSNQEGTGFEIQISTDNENFSTLEIIDDITTNAFSVENLLEGVTYYFKLRVIDTLNQNVSEFITANAITNLITPTNFIATASSNTITLVWKDNSNKEKNYTVEQSLDGINFTVLTTDLERNSTTFEITNLGEETEYFYRVRATNNQIQSAYSNIDSDTTTIAIPTGLSLEVISDTEILATWNNSSNIEDNYVLERSLDGITFSTSFVLGVNVEQYNNTGLTPGTMYFYRIKAVNLNYDGDYSPIVSACTTLNNMIID